MHMLFYGKLYEDCKYEIYFGPNASSEPKQSNLCKFAEVLCSVQYLLTSSKLNIV